MAKEKVFAVFGLGAFGNEVCRHLVENGMTVMAFDNQPEPIERIKDTVSQAFVVDTTDEQALAEAPLADVQVAVVAIGDDMESNILTTAVLKQAGVPYIVARAVSDIHLRVLTQIGANEVINLEIAGGRNLAQRLISEDILDTIPVSADFSISEIYAPDDAADKSTADFQKRFSVNVMCVKRWKTTVDDMGNPKKEELVRLARGADVVRKGDILLVIGRNSDIDALKS